MSVQSSNCLIKA